MGLKFTTQDQVESLALPIEPVSQRVFFIICVFSLIWGSAFIWSQIICGHLTQISDSWQADWTGRPLAMIDQLCSWWSSIFQQASLGLLMWWSQNPNHQETKPQSKALFKTLLTWHLLKFYWPKQAPYSSQVGGRKNKLCLLKGGVSNITSIKCDGCPWLTFRGATLNIWFEKF